MCVESSKSLRRAYLIVLLFHPNFLSDVFDYPIRISGHQNMFVLRQFLFDERMSFVYVCVLGLESLETID